MNVERTDVLNRGIDNQALLDGMGQGVLIFDSANRLIMENRTARTLLGADLKLLRTEGWTAAKMLFNTRSTDPDESIDAIRQQALESDRPVRFHAFRSGERVPCTAAAVHGRAGELLTMITIEQPDWSALTELFDKYLGEVRDTVGATQGHVALITQTIKRHKASESGEQLGKRVSGFSRIIDVHMHRLRLLTEMMERLEDIRTGRLREIVRNGKRKINLRDFLEDFIEELSDEALVDPETERHDERHRIRVEAADDLRVDAVPLYLTTVLRDLLRNAIMYSMKATPIRIVVSASDRDNTVQIDVIDEGYGIRKSETDKVFQPFLRSRQPEIVGEFGYGLSLYLCKHEIEAMNGRVWFESDEGVGTTFSMKLPIWREAPESSAQVSQRS